MSKRDWFDDDEFIEDDGDLGSNFDDNNNNQVIGHNSSTQLSSSTVPTTEDTTIMNENKQLDENLIQSIKDSVDKMKLVELQNSLKKKGLKSSGSKSVLRDRLLCSLLEEVGTGLDN